MFQYHDIWTRAIFLQPYQQILVKVPSHPFDIIPDTYKAEVTAAFKEIFHDATIENTALLSGGFSGSQLFMVAVNSKSYVLKLNPPQPGMNSQTASALATASATGVAPLLHFEDREKGISISDLIERRPLQAVFTGDALLTELARSIKKYHDAPFNGQHKDLFETVDGLIEWFRKANMLSSTVFEESFDWFEKIKSVQPFAKNDLVFSHNDLNPNNVLCDGKKIWIIDWDTAYMNDRYIDLANTANFYVHTPEQEQLYLNTYFEGKVDEIKVARLFIMRQICRLIYSMLMLQLASVSKPAGFLHSQEMEGCTLKEFRSLMMSGNLSLANYEGRLFYGKALIQEALQCMRGERFKNALAQFADEINSGD